LSNKPHFSRWRHQVRREADSGWTIEMNQLLFEIQPACVVCGSTKKLTADHVRPVLLGGKLVPGNVVVLCLACNDKKSYREISRLPKDWQEKIEHAARQFLDMWNSR
jgi:5-methylcytosine-specific restriction endonuclease McrA